MINLKQRFRTFLDISKSWRSHLLLLFLLFIPLILIFTFDALNVEGFEPFNQKFMFDLTWKGRMFYLVFAGATWGSDILLTPDGIEAMYPFPTLSGDDIHLV